MRKVLKQPSKSVLGCIPRSRFRKKFNETTPCVIPPIQILLDRRPGARTRLRHRLRVRPERRVLPRAHPHVHRQRADVRLGHPLPRHHHLQ